MASKQEILARQVTERTESALNNISTLFNIRGDFALSYHRDISGNIVGMDLDIAESKQISSTFPVVKNWPPIQVLKKVVPILEGLALT